MIIGSRSMPTNISNGGNLILVRTQTPIPNEKQFLRVKEPYAIQKKERIKEKTLPLKSIVITVKGILVYSAN